MTAATRILFHIFMISPPSESSSLSGQTGTCARKRSGSTTERSTSLRRHNTFHGERLCPYHSRTHRPSSRALFEPRRYPPRICRNIFHSTPTKCRYRKCHTSDCWMEGGSFSAINAAGLEASRIGGVNWPIAHVSVEINATFESDRILRDEPPDALVVVARSIIVDSSLQIELPGCVSKGLSSRARKPRCNPAWQENQTSRCTRRLARQQSEPRSARRYGCSPGRPPPNGTPGRRVDYSAACWTRHR